MTIASLLREIARRPDTMVYLLRVAGVDRVWASADIALDDETVIPEITDVSEVSAEIDQIDQRVTAGRFSVRIEAGPGSETFDLLMRRTRRGSTRVVQLADDVAQDDDAPAVEAIEDISDWPASGVLHVGTEAMRYSARTTVAPFTFTVVERGYLDTDRQHHVVEAGGLERPLIYDRVTTWGWRPARLSVARRRLDGSPHPREIEICPGWILAAPDPDARGRIAVKIAPLPAGMQVQVGGQPSTTGLVPGLLPIGADDPHRGVLARLRWRRGEAMREPCDGVAGGVISGIVHAPHQDVFDITQSGVRAGPLIISGLSSVGVQAYDGDPEDGSGDIGIADNALAIGGRLLVQNAEVTHDIEVEVAAAGADALVEWPATLIQQIAAAWSPGTTQGAGGLWADVRLEPRIPGIGGAPGITARLNSDAHRGALDVVLPSGRSEGLPSPFRETLWYLADFTDPDAQPNGPQPQPLDGLDPRDVRWPAERVIPVSLGKSDASTPRVVIPIRGLAYGGWQTGMGYVCVRDDVFGDPPFDVRVTFEAQDGSQQATTLQVVDKLPASDWLAGAPGVLLELDPVTRWRSHSFGWFPGRQEPQISQIVRWANVDPRVALLQLLTSTYGLGVNGEYDVLPSGAFIPLDRVDVASFLAFPVPAGVVDLVDDLDLTRPISVENAVRGIVELMQAQITMALDESTGRCVLRLISAGPPIASDARKAFAADDLTISPRFPHGAVDARVLTTQIYEANIDRDDEPQLVVTVDDKAARRENGGRIASRTVRLLGVRLARSAALADAQLRPVAEAKQVVVGAPRHYIVAGCSLVDSLLLHPGSVVTITAPTALDERGQPGTLIDVPARIIEMRRFLKKATAEMTLVYLRNDIAGVAPALRVTASPTADSVIVMANRYTEAVHPITGEAQLDLDYWRVGDRARVVPRGRYEDSLGELYVRAFDKGTGQVWFDVDDGAGGLEPAVLPAVARAAPFATVRFEKWSLANGEDEAGDPRTWGQTLEAQGRHFAFIGPIAGRVTADNRTGAYQMA